MAWIVLILSGLCEAVWATALAHVSRAEGAAKIVPGIVFLVACGASMGGLAWALRDIPVGTGYAVWTAIGAATTIIWAMVTGAESASVIKLLLLLGLFACVIGLKVVSDAH